MIKEGENVGGFRKKLCETGSGKYVYFVLYTSMEELEWPDFLDEEAGISRYYRDSRELTDTKKSGSNMPTRFEQLPAGSDTEGLLYLDAIQNHYNYFK